MSLALTDDRGITRFTEKFKVSEAGCWEWIAALDPNGYGRFGMPGATRADWRMKLAHRVSYETFAGPIPEGLDLDHLCRNRSCVNPEHLEPVTRSENLRRSPLMARGQDKTHCPHGHEYSPENTRITKAGARACRTCERKRNRDKTRSGEYNPPTPCEVCGKVLRERNLPKHYRAFHPDIARALRIETP